MLVARNWVASQLGVSVASVVWSALFFVLLFGALAAVVSFTQGRVARGAFEAGLVVCIALSELADIVSPMLHAASYILVVPTVALAPIVARGSDNADRRVVALAAALAALAAVALWTLTWGVVAAALRTIASTVGVLVGTAVLVGGALALVTLVVFGAEGAKSHVRSTGLLAAVLASGVASVAQAMALQSAWSASVSVTACVAGALATLFAFVPLSSAVRAFGAAPGQRRDDPYQSGHLRRGSYGVPLAASTAAVWLLWLAATSVPAGATATAAFLHAALVVSVCWQSTCVVMGASDTSIRWPTAFVALVQAVLASAPAVQGALAASAAWDAWTTLVLMATVCVFALRAPVVSHAVTAALAIAVTWSCGGGVGVAPWRGALYLAVLVAYSFAAHCVPPTRRELDSGAVAPENGLLDVVFVAAATAAHAYTQCWTSHAALGVALVVCAWSRVRPAGVVPVLVGVIIGALAFTVLPVPTSASAHAAVGAARSAIQSVAAAVTAAFAA